ncbi:MAG TPA: YkgJ family cysteine cluster protein [Rhodocyclaceae bacterium]|nr:YkgJ family cysteine cluster protein [Rhodocyclaceae bacterium]
MADDNPFPTSPVMPEMFDGDKVIQFSCHKGIACFNACCKNIDISLTPYDILRLKQRLGVSSTEFLELFTLPYEIEKDGIAGVKLRPVEGGSACQFMTDEGCSVYEDRPTACRYYPVALLSMRRQDEYVDRNAYALVKEEHCLGHLEPRSISVDDYRKEQGLTDYDELARGWRQLILKKKSSGPSIGKPSKRSLQLFFMSCYDIDRFRDFVSSASFNALYDIAEEERTLWQADDVALMQFAFRFLRQVLFGEEEGIKMREAAAEERRRQVQDNRLRLEREAAERLARQKDDMAED